MEKYSNRPNRKEMINSANIAQVIDRVERLGVEMTALLYNCISKDVVERLAKEHVQKVFIPNVKITEDKIFYMYKEQGVMFMSKRLGGSYYKIVINGKQSNKVKLHFDKVNVEQTEDEISVSLNEVNRLLDTKSSLEVICKMLNVHQHRIVKFAGIEIEDEDDDVTVEDTYKSYDVDE